MKEKKTDIADPIEATIATTEDEGGSPQEDNQKEKAEGDKGKAEGKKAKTDTPDTPADEPHSLKEAIKETAREEERPLSRTFSLKKVLGGDLLNTAFIRQQIWLFVLIGVFTVVYISNRYSCQQDILEIDQLQRHLQDAKYRALSSTSELTEKSRESNVLNALKAQRDSTLKMPSEAPFYIKVPEEEAKGE